MTRRVALGLLAGVVAGALFGWFFIAPLLTDATAVTGR